MDRNKIKTPFVSLGTSSLMVVFLVLCLASFRVLSLSGAKSDYSLSEKSAAHSRRYYDADSKARYIAEFIDFELESAWDKPDFESGQDYIACMGAQLDGLDIDGVKLNFDGNDLITYLVPVEEGLVLKVELKICNPQTSRYFHEVISWNTAADGSWQRNDKLQLVPID